jgi:endonuclease/exonuclease/phosphatase family metal-dependent hydrolase
MKLNKSMAKKSRIRIFGKGLLLSIHLILVLLLLYPQFFMPLSFIWVNGFLSLLAPYIIVLHLLFLFIWLIAKPILSLISVLTLGIAYPTILVLFAWHPGTPFAQKKKDNSLRITSFNVKEFNGNTPQPIGHKLRTEDIAASIQKWDPDVICLQEYNTKELKNDIANHATYFDQKYPYSFFSKDHQINTANYFAGNIIYSKYKILYAERVPFSNQESLIFVDLLKGDDTVRVFTTHLASFKFKQNDFEAIDDAVDANKAALKAKYGVIRKMKNAFMIRAVQASIIQAQLDKSPYPAIITGDFNDVPSSYTYKLIKGEMQDAFLAKGFGIGATYMNLSPTLRIDYIMADNKWQVKGWESLDENLSDHHMIMADLQLLKN